MKLLTRKDGGSADESAAGAQQNPYTSVRDTAGNTIAFTSWQFTTGPAPTVVSVSPGIGATNVSRMANVTVRYSEPVTNVNTGTVVLRRGGLTGPVVTAAVTYNATTRTATLNPSATLAANTTYTVATSSVRDLAGNPLVFRSWTFRTGAV